MELIERPNLKAVAYLNTISFETFRNDCVREAEENGEPAPLLKDIKTWYSILQQFCKTNIKTKGITKRIYSYSQNTPAGLGGRLFSGGSLQSIWNVYRGLLMKGIGTDIDMSNCHPVILRYVCRLHNIDCPELEYYINNRDYCLSQFSKKSHGKTAYLIATNNDVLSRKKDAPACFKRYDREMKAIQKQLVDNPEYRALFDTIPEYRASKNYNGCAINRILCYYENIILGHAIHILNLKGIEIAILMFDGLMVYGDYYQDPQLLQDIEEHVESAMTGLNMKWAYKEHDGSLVIPENFDYEESSADEYTKWKIEFEKEWCKIKNLAIFIRRYTRDGKTSHIFQTERGLITAYRHETMFRPDDNGKEKKVSLINEWLCDKDMRCYDTASCVPPPLTCPDNIFNLWIPSPFEDMKITKDDTDFDLDAVSAFATHLKILCGNDLDIYKYVCNWIAHSIQRPGEKPQVALNFISNQGVGKNIFSDVLVELYGGTSKKLETSQPERDVWGNFNDMMTDAFLVILSETDKRNALSHDGKIKSLITDGTMVVNPKGLKSFTIDSYHRIIQLTNDKDPVITSNDDRRNVIIRCSDEKKGDSQYFTDLVETFQGKHALRSIYWCFKVMDISEFKLGVAPRTEYHKEIISHNVNPLELFMRWFIEQNEAEYEIELSSTDLLANFTTWRHMTRMKFGEHMNVLSLLKKLKLELQVPEKYMRIKETKYGNIRIFDIANLKTFFKMNEEQTEPPPTSTNLHQPPPFLEPNFI